MSQRRDRYGLWALIFYLLLSFLFFGRGLIGHFSTFHMGEGADPPLMIWFLVWWPYALFHGINPFLTNFIWAPSGFNLTWQTSIPLIGMLAAPFTTSFGPIAALNILCLLSLPFASWCAFFLCRRLSDNYWTSALGGYIFGFCPFLIGQLHFARLHLIWSFPVPLIVYLMVLRFDGIMSKGRFRALLSLFLVVEFLCSVEIFATMTLFSAIVLGLAWLLNPGDVRLRLSTLIPDVGYSYIVALFVVSPYLYYFFLGAHPYEGPVWPASMVEVDPIFETAIGRS